nr:restriction endonuclease subunit S [Mitsuokella multacida]
MNAQDLKNSILQRAIEGKLVPQRKEEGTAKELLAEIRAEKARLIKEKKIKKSKPLPEITDDEKPFDIPESWEWVRLDDICKSISDGDHQAPPKSEKGVPFLVISDVRSGKLNFKNTRHVPVEYFKTLSPERIPLKGDILFTVTGSYGIPVLINVDMEFCFQRHIALLKPMIDYTFLSYILESPFIKTQCDAVATGTAQKTVGLKSLKSLLLPLPPLYEQGRIITKIEELQPDIDAYDKAQTKLQAIEQRFPDDMKKSLLQYAIEGKLVPQRKEEGTAKDLLAEIRAEKARLVKEKKIKKSKPLLDITDDEKPFDIPDSWEWVRLGDIIELQSGQDFSPSKYSDTDKDGTPYITGASSFTENGVLENRWTKCPKCIATKGDILLVCKGSGYGKVTICNLEEAHIARQIMAIKQRAYLNITYIKFFLMARIKLIKKNGQGVIPGISRDIVLNLLFPLPPLAEQHRIVTKLEELLPLCQQLASYP